MFKTSLHRGSQALAELGFSELEAQVYCFLLAESPATGYRISHGIGKPTANTYKAISTLKQKGAITVDDGENQQCRAVPPEELLQRLERSFRDRKASAMTALREIHRDEADDRVYQLATVDQVVERARTMLQNAKKSVVLDIFPGPLELLEDSIRRALKRKVLVYMLTYKPVAIPGAVAVWKGEKLQGALSLWPGQQLSLVVDAREHLLALLASDLASVHQAVWSQSTFLSCLHFNHLACEIKWTAVDSLEPDDPLLAETKALSLLRSAPLGLEDLNRRFGKA